MIKRAQQAEQNRARLLEAAAVGLLLLRRHRNAAVSAALARGLPPIRIAHHIRASVERAAFHARDGARDIGSARLRAELTTLEREATERFRNPREILQDLNRSRKAAETYSKRWLAAAEADTARTANAATDYALERAALTEASHAFNEARLAELRDLPPAVVADLKREWDAESGACPVCAAADGTIVGVNENFPLGEPGDVHPNCACSWSLVGH